MWFTWLPDDQSLTDQEPKKTRGPGRGDHRARPAEQLAPGVCEPPWRLWWIDSRGACCGWVQRRLERRQELLRAAELGRGLDLHELDQPLVIAQPVLARIAEQPPRGPQVGLGVISQ